MCAPYSWKLLAAWIQFLSGRFHVFDQRLTPHCLRRGGATWHFQRHGSYDLTQELGRWKQAKVAKLYINAALAEAAAHDLPAAGAALLDRVTPLTALFLDEVASALIAGGPVDTGLPPPVA